MAKYLIDIELVDDKYCYGCPFVETHGMSSFCKFLGHAIPYDQRRRLVRMKLSCGLKKLEDGEE